MIKFVRNPLCKLFLCTIFTILFVTACTQSQDSGQQFDAAAASKIKIGITPKSEVQAMLGNPYGRDVMANGTETWTYVHSHYQFTGAPGLYSTFIEGKNESEAKRLTITFKKDVVADCILYTSSSSGSGTTLTPYSGAGTNIEKKCGQ